MSTPTIASGCCCPQTANYQCLSDCIFDIDITSGCCHWDDTLLLWNERPGYSIRQEYRITDVGNLGSTPCETCTVTAQRSMPPVQSIYKYHSCWFRYVTALSPVELAVPWPVADNTLGQGSGCGHPVCEPQYCLDQYPDCCNDGNPFPNPADCNCNAHYGQGKGGLTEWRRDKLLENHDTTWFVEMACHKSGQPLTTGGGPLASGWLCNVFFERWWKIAECPPTARIYVPGCNQTTSDCDGQPFVTNDLVPKWWIFACSGVPMYSWELAEAEILGIITQGERFEILDAIDAARPLPQSVMFKLAEAGYFVAKDWRSEQRQAYIDLHARFPTAGYGQCIQTVESMNVPNGLGPFRKRYTPPNPATNAAPYLHKSDVISELAPFQAVCMKNYPGSALNAEDYRFWRERQWVYFRGIPGGWTWAGWNSLALCGSVCGSEEEAILLGYGRGVGVGGPNVISAPMLAFSGNPMPPETLTNCNFSGNEICNDTVYCDSTNGGCDDCGTGPVAACDPPSECLRLTVDSMCEGVHFVFHNYTVLNDLEPDANQPTECSAKQRYVCRSVHSFLVEARRKVDNWDLAIPFRCRTMTPPLGPFQQFPEIEESHAGPQPLCNQMMDPNDTTYPDNPLCCGGYCNGFVDVEYDGGNAPCYQGTGNTIGCPTRTENQDDCSARDDCPPHSTQKQIGCIGHPIICFDIPELPPEWPVT